LVARKLKIVKLVSGFSFVHRGGEVLSYELYKHFNQMGANADLFFCCAKKPIHPKPIRTGSYHSVPCLKRYLFPQGPFRVNESLSEIIESISFSLASFPKLMNKEYDIYMSGPSPSTYTLSLIKKCKNVKLVHHLGCQPYTFTKPLLYPLKYYDAVVVGSNFIKNQLQLVHKINGHLIRNGVDTNKFHPDSSLKLKMRQLLKIPIDDSVIMFAGPLISKKGVYTLLKSFNLLPNNCWLIYVGYGPEYKGLYELSNKLNISDRVILTGRVPEMPPYYAMADLVAIPYQYNDASPIVPLEALSSGTPVLVGRAGGAPESIIEGKTGFSHRPGDHEDLHKKLLYLVTNKKMLNSMSRNARAYALNTLDWSRVANEYLDLFNNLME